MTSPVERISGPGSGSTPGNRSKGKTGSLTATSDGTPSWTPSSARLAPAQTLAASSAHGSPGGAGEERHRPRRPGVDLDEVDHALLDGELDIHQTTHTEGEGEKPDLASELGLEFEGQAHRRGHGARITRVDTGLFDVLHDAADDHPLAIGHRVDIDFGGLFEEVVEQNRPVGIDGGRALEVLGELIGTVDDLHGATAENIGRPHQERISELCTGGLGLVGG